MTRGGASARIQENYPVSPVLQALTFICFSADHLFLLCTGSCLTAAGCPLGQQLVLVTKPVPDASGVKEAQATCIFPVAS